MTVLAAPEPRPPAEVRRVWDQAPHNAFTDLIRFHGRWFLAFREGRAHVSPDGSARILSSADGVRWSSEALVTYPGDDLRDPKLTITPAGDLMLSTAAALPQPGPARHQSLVWTSRTGSRWVGPVAIGDPDLWLWRVVWHKGTAYSVGYGTGDRKFARLYSSPDGRRFNTLVEDLHHEGYPNETALVFLKDDTCLCLLRRDGTPTTGLLGTSRPPYREWTWKDTGVKIGGPQMIQLPDGRLVAGLRLYDGKVRTALCWVDPATAKLTEFVSLPSGGDTSYPGLVWRDGVLWVSYYSSHEGKTSIYLAKVPLGTEQPKRGEFGSDQAAGSKVDTAGAGAGDRRLALLAGQGLFFVGLDRGPD